MKEKRLSKKEFMDLVIAEQLRKKRLVEKAQKEAREFSIECAIKHSRKVYKAKQRGCRSF